MGTDAPDSTPPHQLGPSVGSAGGSRPQPVPPVYLTPLERSEQKSPEMPKSGLPAMDAFQRYTHAGWSGIRSKVHAALCRTSQPESRVKNFENCCRSPRLEWAGESEVTATEWRLKADRCHDRLCTPCALARSLKIREALWEQLAGQSHKFITLTLRSTADEPLTSCIDRLYAGFRALRRIPTWEKAVLGGAAFLEITRGANTIPGGRAGCGRPTAASGLPGIAGGHWHAHLHVIADATFISKTELSVAWRAATTDSYIVDIQAAGGGESAKYVTKYVTKALAGPVLGSPDLLDEFVVAMRGRRLCTTFGTWYGTNRLSSAEDADLDIDECNGKKWQHAEIYSVDRIVGFLPQTLPAAHIARLPFIRWVRSGSARPPPT